MFKKALYDIGAFKLNLGLETTARKKEVLLIGLTAEHFLYPGFELVFTMGQRAAVPPGLYLWRCLTFPKGLK